jgi:phenylpropionate dioxygenase-like ring-hydroxylating dioxygenase large terminal subunit
MSPTFTASNRGQLDHDAPLGEVPKLTGDIRHLIPKYGLRNYWYPAISAHKVPKRRPVQISMLGEELVFFRGKDGTPVALQDVCPHRGARLSEGHIHWEGLVACPYHGWVFDEHGKNVMILSEGPDSKVCGKAGTEAYVYPTQVLKGVVFAWIGDTKPAPIEEDVPPEFFDPKAYVMWNDHVHWPTNWLVALENSMDSHVAYLHRDTIGALLGQENFGARGAQGYRPAFTGNGFRAGTPAPSANGTVIANGMRMAPKQDEYPGGYKWPKHHFRKWWNWMFLVPLFIGRVPSPKTYDNEWWGNGHRLPGYFRAGGFQSPARGLKKIFAKTGSGLVGMYTRWPVALEPWKTRLWYFHYSRPANRLQRWYFKFLYNTWGRWAAEYNFSIQDGSMMFNQRYDWPEKLSGHDAEVIQWRRLIVTKALGGRYAAFGYDHDKDGAGIDERKVEAPLGTFSKGGAIVAGNEIAAG